LADFVRRGGSSPNRRYIAYLRFDLLSYEKKTKPSLKNFVKKYRVFLAV